MPAITKALKEKAPYWAEKMPEIPDLIYGALRQHKYLQSNIDQLTQQLKSQRNKQRKSQYLLGIGATFILCGSLFFISDFKQLAVVFMAAGALSWLFGWCKTDQN
ncbi:hypothetical protein MASR2M36_38250 [Providencia sp.]